MFHSVSPSARHNNEKVMSHHSNHSERVPMRFLCMYEFVKLREIQVRVRAQRKHFNI